MKKTLTCLLALCMALTIVLTACGPSGSTESQSPVTSSDPAASDPADTESEGVVLPSQDGVEKVLKGWTSPRTTFNPQMYTNSKSIENLGTFVAQMAKMDGSNEMEVVPYFAEELPSSEDGLVWTVKLREGLTWNDGTPINADTYIYSGQMLLDPKLVNSNASYLFTTCIVVNAEEYFKGNCAWEDVGLKKIDDLTLEFTLEYPASELDFNTTIGALFWPVKEDVYEACMNEDRTSTTYATSLETTPSCGAWTLTKWVIDGYEEFEVNENDPLVQMGYYKLDAINQRYLSSSATRSELFFSNELDYHTLTADEYAIYKDDPRVYQSESPNVWGIFVNADSDNPIMANKDFRMALQYSAPREELAVDVFAFYTPANYMISTGTMVTDADGNTVAYRDTDLAKANAEQFANDNEKALEYFEKAYEANGNQKITVNMLYFDGQESMKRWAEVCQETWETLFGRDRFELTVTATVAATCYDIYETGNYDLGCGVRLATVFNPYEYMYYWTTDYPTKYITGFDNEEFDELYQEAAFGDLVTDPAKRLEALARMEQLIMEEGAFIPIMQNDNVFIYNSRIWLATEEYLPQIGYAVNQCDIVEDPTA